jgi:predicted PurR-regulated permease PerM
VLRPILVGRDTQMHALMIFFSTLGGLLAFGAMGFILGPILAALFLTVWEMFGVAFRTELREAPPVVVTDREVAGPERTS